MGLERLLSGSAASVEQENFSGFVTLKDTVITHIAYGHGKFTSASPDDYAYPALENIDDIAISAGCKVPIKFSSIRFNGSLALLKGNI